MRGKLRDKRDMKRDRLRREVMVRKTSKRDNRNLQLMRQINENDDYSLDNDDELTVEEEQGN